MTTLKSMTLQVHAAWAVDREFVMYIFFWAQGRQTAGLWVNRALGSSKLTVTPQL